MIASRITDNTQGTKEENDDYWKVKQFLEDDSDDEPHAKIREYSSTTKDTNKCGLFRIAKQLKLSNLIDKCETSQLFCRWLKFNLDEMGMKNGIRFMANMFLKHKSLLDNNLVDQFLESAQMYFENNDIKKQNKQNKSKLNLNSLPNGVLCHISFYLPLSSCLKLSMTSHSFHEKIQNNQCLGVKSQHDRDNKMIKLCPQILTIIGENNCIMECMHKHTRIDIKSSDNDCSWDCNDCPLSHLIDKIEKDENYDLLWFKRIWSNMQWIYISNEYPCVLNHVPMSWIFDAHHNSYDIETLGTPPDGSNLTVRISMSKEIVDNFAKKFKSYLNDSRGKETRKIRRLWHCRVKCDFIQIFSSFGHCLTGVSLDLPRIWDDNKCRFEQLDTFFKVFHENLTLLEIHMDRDKIGSSSIASQLFKNNKPLSNDLEKSEQELPFNQFLKKYNCQNKCLPKIWSLEMAFYKIFPHEQSALSKLIKNDKIMKLLNLQQSVRCVTFLLGPIDVNTDTRKVDIQNLNQLAISKLDNLEYGEYSFCLNERINKDEIEKYLTLANDLVLQMAIKHGTKCVYLAIGVRDWIYQQALSYKLKIETKDELLYKNRDSLRKKISCIVNDSIEDVKKIWIENPLVIMKIVFEFERAFSV